jgi:SAM-dependent methyltransferase
MNKSEDWQDEREGGEQRCVLCGGHGSWPLPYDLDPVVEDRVAKIERNRRYRWFLCQTCGNGYPTFVPELSVLSALWKTNRDISEADQVREDGIWQNRRRISRIGAERSLKLFSPLQKGAPGRFVDIACGLGATVSKFAEHGWDAQGIDADPTVKRFHEELGIQSKIGQIETVGLNGKFDVVHIAHAIYFITEPMRFLRSVKDVLTDDGLLCVVLANFLSNDDLGLPGYPHSFFPTAASMQYLLSRAGFRNVMCRHLSGSIYLAARSGVGPSPSVHPRLIRLGYQTKNLRYATIGRPKLWLRGLAKSALQSVKG